MIDDREGFKCSMKNIVLNQNNICARWAVMKWKNETEIHKYR